MSFSRQVKEELINHVDSSRHCQIAELAAIIHFLGLADSKGIRIVCENDALKRKYFTLLKKTFNIDDACCEEDVKRMILAVDGPMVTQKSCCRRAYLRGAFLSAGSINDPDKSYHLEIACSSEQEADKIRDMLKSFEIEAKQVIRKKYYVVYIKEGAQIVETLNVIGAHVALMDYENSRILKEMRNSVNRRVNCETANIVKTVSASVKQLDDIRLIMDSGTYKTLSDPLKEMCDIRIRYPNVPLKELGELMDPPVGKSGVNHRLRKLSEIADGLRIGGEL